MLAHSKHGLNASIYNIRNKCKYFHHISSSISFIATLGMDSPLKFVSTKYNHLQKIVKTLYTCHQL